VFRSDLLGVAKLTTTSSAHRYEPSLLEVPQHDESYRSPRTAASSPCPYWRELEQRRAAFTLAARGGAAR